MPNTIPPAKQLARLSVAEMQNALPKLQRRIDEIKAIDPTYATGTHTPEFSAVIDNANATLMEVFGNYSVEYDRFKILSIYAGRNSYTREIPQHEVIEGYLEGRKRALIKIDSAIKWINEKLADAQSATDTSQKEEEWISAERALALLGMNHPSGQRTICKRAYAGLIKARAERFIGDGCAADNVEVPAEFWWAEGEAALAQNWTTGDFETWINHTVHLQAFGVTFRHSDIERLKPAKTLEQEGKIMATAQKVFIGHGHSPVWRELKDFLQDRLYLTIDEFNSVSTAGVATSNRLEEMLNNVAFEFLILTAEDEQVDGTLRARENVVHEAGLFQGKLGFKKAIILLEEGCEKFSNIHGLGYIPFPKGKMNATFEQVREVLEREKVIDPQPRPAGDPPPGSKPPQRSRRLRYTHPRNRKE